MTVNVLATATIDGPEARGLARFLRAPDGAVTVELDQFWVAPGAPDVRLFISSDPAGNIDNTATDLGPVPDRTATLSFPLPAELDLEAGGSIVVYCKVYSVHFGHGILSLRR
jgi:hypothetical protein